MKAIRIKPRILALAALLATVPLTALAVDSELTPAIKQGQTRVVTDMLKRSIDVNARETDGTTPLQWAIYNEQRDLVRALLRADADPELANREGKTLRATVLAVEESVVVLRMKNGVVYRYEIANLSDESQSKLNAAVAK